MIKKNDAFREVIEKGKNWRGRLIKVFYMESDKNAVGFSVPKKIGNAVLRNRIKRLMREVYRKHRDELPQFHMVWIARENWDSIGFQHLEKELQSFIININRQHGCQRVISKANSIV